MNNITYANINLFTNLFKTHNSSNLSINQTNSTQNLNDKIIFYTNSTEFFFPLNTKAYIPLYIENKYNKPVQGMLTYSIEQKINTLNMKYSNVNTNSKTFVIKPQNSTILLSLGSASQPMSLTLSISFQYSDLNTSSQNEVYLPKIKIYFVNMNNSNKNQNNKQNNNQQNNQENKQTSQNKNLNKQKNQKQQINQNNQESKNTNQQSNLKQSNQNNNLKQQNNQQFKKIMSKTRTISNNHQNNQLNKQLNQLNQIQNQINNQMLHQRLMNALNNQIQSNPKHNLNNKINNKLLSNKQDVNSNAIKQNIKQELNKYNQEKQVIKQELMKNNDFKRLSSELQKQGYKLSNYNIDPNNKKFNFEYKKDNKIQRIYGNYQNINQTLNKQGLNQKDLNNKNSNLINNTLDNQSKHKFNVHSTLNDSKIINKTLNNKKINELNKKLLSKGYKLINKSITHFRNSTRIKLDYKNKKNQTKSVEIDLDDKNKIKKITIKNQRNKRNYFILLILFLLLAFFIWYKLKHSKKQELKQETIVKQPLIIDINKLILKEIELSELFLKQNKFKDSIIHLSKAYQYLIRNLFNINKEITNIEAINILNNLSNKPKHNKNIKIKNLIKVSEFKSKIIKNLELLNELEFSKQNIDKKYKDNIKEIISFIKDLSVVFKINKINKPKRKINDNNKNS